MSSETDTRRSAEPFRLDELRKQIIEHLQVDDQRGGGELVDPHHDVRGGGIGAMAGVWHGGGAPPRCSRDRRDAPEGLDGVN